MAIVNVKEIYKEFGLAKKHFKKAIELAKGSVVIGEIHFPGTTIKVRTRKVKVTPETEGKAVTVGNAGKADLADLDKDGYMSKRKKHETADNA